MRGLTVEKRDGTQIVASQDELEQLVAAAESAQAAGVVMGIAAVAVGIAAVVIGAVAGGGDRD